jgi:hypothetical protein
MKVKVKVKTKVKVKMKMMKKATVIHQTKESAMYRGLPHEDIVIHQGNREPLMEIAMNTDRVSL